MLRPQQADLSAALSGPARFATIGAVLPRPGSVLVGRYRIEAEIGRGASGRVYHAHDRELDEEVALKIVQDTTPAGRTALLTEVRLARRVTHPNVCRIHDVHEGPPLFFTMERIVGRDLSDVEPPSFVRAVEIARDIARGLAAAHAEGIVHRDLKPRNVLLSDDGRVVLTDFGIARALSESTGGSSGERVGTPRYAAPEQFTGERVGPRADVFSLGVLLQELLTGKNPFGEGSTMQTAMSRIHGRPEPPTGLPAAIGRLLERMLARAPVDRPDMAEVAEALQHHLDADPEAHQLFALGPPRRTVAVLPFRYRGPDERAFLGEAIAEELVDLLAGTRGLELLSFGVTSELGPTPPLERLVGLGADAIISGSVQVDADRVRVRTRVSDPAGRQSFSDGVTADLGDLFDLQARIARRIAESLRVEFEHLHVREQVPPRAMSLYLRARLLLRSHRHEADAAVEMLSEAVALAPHCGAFVASHALAAARSAGFSETLEDPATRREISRASLDRAVTHAADYPDTQLALAFHHRATGDLRQEVAALRHALRLAPTTALAHSRLGELISFTGHRDAARDSMLRAYALDPHERWACRNLARLEAFAGHPDEVHRWMGLALEGRPETALLFEAIRMEHYTGRADYDAVAGRLTDLPAHQMAMLFCNVAKGETEPEALDLVWAAMKEWWSGQAWMRVVAVETLAELRVLRGRHEPALDLLEENEEVLADVAWIDDCPVLAPLREDPRFRAIAERVHERAEALAPSLVRPA